MGQGAVTSASALSRQCSFAGCYVSWHGFSWSQDVLLAWDLHISPLALSQMACGASTSPLLLCWGRMIVSDGPEWWADDLGRVRPNPCVAPGMGINIAQVIAHALLRTRSQLQASWEAPWPGQQGTQFLFLELWSAPLCTAGFRTPGTPFLLNKGAPFTSLHPMRAGMCLRSPHHKREKNFRAKHPKFTLTGYGTLVVSSLNLQHNVRPTTGAQSTF